MIGANAVTADTLAALVAYLNDNGYRLGIDDELRLHTLHKELWTRGGGTAGVEALADWLAPVVCRDADEQERLPQLIATWLGCSEPPARSIPEVPSLAITPWELETPLPPQRPAFLRWDMFALIALIVAALVAVVYLRITGASQEVGKSAGALQTPGNRIIAPILGLFSLSDLWYRILLPIFPALVAIALLWRLGRSEILTRVRSSVDVAHAKLRLAARDARVFSRRDLWSAMRELRRHARRTVDEIDVGRTVGATARAAGFVSVVYRQRLVRPEYLILSSRSSSRDLLNDLAGVLGTRLAEEQVEVIRAEYFGDPRILSIERRGGSELVALKRIAADRPDIRLVIFADPATFWDPRRGRWREWVDAFHAFAAPALLTPAPVEKWGERERALSARGFLVAPATSDGLTLIARWYRGDKTGLESGKRGSDHAALFSMLEADPYLWTGDVAPPSEMITDLLDALRRELGSTTFHLLCATAVFPGLDSRLTEEIGVVVLSPDEARQPVLSENGLVMLARLPWFRVGSMPDWLRAALIAAMPPDLAEQVRQAWTALLSTEPSRSGPEFSLSERANGEAMRNRLIRLMRRGAAPVHAERILLAFLDGRRLSPLELPAPERASRSLSRRIVSSRSFWAMLGLGALLAVAGSNLRNILLQFASYPALRVAAPFAAILAVLLAQGRDKASWRRPVAQAALVIAAILVDTSDAAVFAVHFLLLSAAAAAVVAERAVRLPRFEVDGRFNLNAARSSWSAARNTRFSTLAQPRQGAEAIELSLEEPQTLPPGLTRFSLLMLGIGSVIGTGIFVLTSNAAQTAGPGMILSFLLAGAVNLAIASCYAELTQMVPSSGGVYAFVRAAFGDLAGWLAGWAFTGMLFTTAAAVAVGWSEFLNTYASALLGVVLPPSISQSPDAGGILNLPAVALIMLLTFLLSCSTRLALAGNALLVAAKLAVLLGVGLFALPYLKPQNLEPFLPRGLLGEEGLQGGVIGAALMIFYAFVGYEVIATATEEAKRPQRDVPAALRLTVIFSTLGYVLVAVSITGILGAQPISTSGGLFPTGGSAEFTAQCAGLEAQIQACSRAPLESALRAIDLSGFASIITPVAALTFPSIVLGALFALSRVTWTIARDGALPAVLAHRNSQRSVPKRAIWAVGAITAALAGFAPVGILADLSNSLSPTLTAAAALALLVLRRQFVGYSELRSYHGYLAAPIAIVAAILLASQATSSSWAAVFAWIGVGLTLRLLLNRSRDETSKSTRN